MTNLIKEGYGKQFKEHLLEQYKLYFDSSDKLSSRRLTTNSFYLTLNSIIIGFSGYLSTVNQEIMTFIISCIGILISCLWVKNISSYKELNTAKFKVIHELEKYLPARIFSKEDEYLGSYYKQTKIESYVPKIFLVLYIILILITGIKYFFFFF